MEKNYETIVLGGGCFWCTEAVFKMIKGIVSAEPGYSGGRKANPTYEEVSSGSTGHIEVAKLTYDSSIISFDDLLTVFFGTHNPSTKDRQGNDVGPQYNSVIFFSTLEQKEKSEKFIADLNAKKEGDFVITVVRPLEKFWPAEDYHKNYYETHKEMSYCQIVINPKLEKVQQHFSNLLKEKT